MVMVDRASPMIKALDQDVEEGGVGIGQVTSFAKKSEKGGPPLLANGVSVS
jgi:hypothetical protein